jgi:hypothetical protein
MSRGHRGDFFVPHKQGMLARWPRCTRLKRPSWASPATQITIYHCRTSRSPESGAAFNFWHPDLVTLHVWLWYPNPAGIYNGANPYIGPFNRS